MDIKVNEKSVIVFDLDDTLYNETDYLRSAYTEIAQETDPEHWKILFARMISLFRSGEDVFGFISNTYKPSKPELLAIYRNHFPTLSPFQGVLKTLRRIKEKKGHTGIITDGREQTQRKKLEALGVLKYIDKIVISEETGAEKPEEKNYKIIEETFKNCTYCYVADNIRKDFIAPNRLGWKTIGLIDNGLNIHYDSYLYFDPLRLPSEFALSFKEINIF